MVRGETGTAEGEVLNVASPLLVDGAPVGVVSLQVAQPADQQRAVTQLLAWGTVWLQALVETESLASRQRLTALRGVLCAGEQTSTDAFEETAARLADLVVISDDILTCPEDEIGDAQILMTIVDGETVYSDPLFAGIRGGTQSHPA